MTTYGLAVRPTAYDKTTWRQEVREAMRDAVRTPGVLVALIVCGTVVALGLLGVLGWLLYAQRDATVILSLVNMAVSLFVWTKVHSVDRRTGQIEKQTNGTSERLLDAALNKRE